MKLDILFFAAHPDDVELSCAGTILLEKARNQKIGVIDLTQGELGSRGSWEKRAAEARAASEKLGLDLRDNLKLADGFFENSWATQEQVIRQIRRYQPRIVVANAPEDRHPDHGRAAALVQTASFLSGLRKIETRDAGAAQAPHRPFQVYFYIQDRWLKPDFVVAVPESVFEQKMESILCYDSQFYAGTYQSEENETYISTPAFLEAIRSRGRQMGHLIGATYGEGFLSAKTVGVGDLAFALSNPF